jgi:hypothetical protein
MTQLTIMSSSGNCAGRAWAAAFALHLKTREALIA